MKSFIKWPGGKTSEMEIILKNIPSFIDSYYEPFVGGGAVYFNIKDCEKFFINDKSKELISLYKNINKQDKEFFQKIKEIDKCWELLETITKKHLNNIEKLYKKYRNDNIDNNILEKNILLFIKNNSEDFNGMFAKDFNIDEKNMLLEFQTNLIKKLKRMKKIEQEKGKLSIEDVRKNIETGFKSGLYMHFRFLYNNLKKFKINNSFASAIFYFIREYCYSSMFRYNQNGDFNVPYGGISYNKKTLKDKIEYIQSNEVLRRLKKTLITKEDFEVFLNKYEFFENDFIFLDPPYDTNFSTYSNNNFGFEDHIRLSDFCKKTKAKFMLVIKNTDFIYNLYKSFNIKSFDKKYSVSLKNRNDRSAKHLIITNY
ncbi:DNA adenine methylase [Fusobacterium polymorphum]|jgi:hypothetical protein|uniref:DNA adenine methylase n=1 Tax=Fusobacterium nucleatum subsp. polymorphum TaxID=76857 RepID=UPI0030CCB601